MRYIFLTTIFSVVYAYEKDITFTVQAGVTDCFYQKVMPQEIIDIEYQVIDASYGELDISFQLTDPEGRVLVADYKKPENAHKHTSNIEGDYRFCFDNTFSTFSQKTVFFDLMIDGDDTLEKDYDDDKEMELGNAAETYMMRVRDIAESVARVRDHVSAARRLQEQHSAHEARDRNVAEEVNSMIMKWSICQMLLMVCVGISQVSVPTDLDEQGDPVSNNFGTGCDPVLSDIFGTWCYFVTGICTCYLLTAGTGRTRFVFTCYISLYI